MQVLDRSEKVVAASDDSIFTSGQGQCTVMVERLNNIRALHQYTTNALVDQTDNTGSVWGALTDVTNGQAIDNEGVENYNQL